jgi:hypothetical protein
MASLDQARAAKETFKKKFPNLMVGIVGSSDDMRLTVRIPEESTKDKIPNFIEGVAVEVVKASYEIKKREE